MSQFHNIRTNWIVKVNQSDLMANNGLDFSNQDGSIKREKKLECKNQQDYLKSLPSNVLERLYNHPTICLAVYRYSIK